MIKKKTVFPNDYEGEEDQYKWVKEWEQALKPALLKLIFDSLRKHSSWKAHVRNRGASPLDEIEIALVKSFQEKKTGQTPIRKGVRTLIGRDRSEGKHARGRSRCVPD